MRMMKKVNYKKLKLLIDTAGQNATEPNLYSAIKKVAKDLVYVHVNDNMGERRGDIHWPPGRGNVNWELFFKTLKEVGYNGYLLVQVHSVGYPIDIDGWAYESKQYLDKLLDKLGIENYGYLGFSIFFLFSWLILFEENKFLD